MKLIFCFWFRIKGILLKPFLSFYQWVSLSVCLSVSPYYLYVCLCPWISSSRGICVLVSSWRTAAVPAAAYDDSTDGGGGHCHKCYLSLSYANLMVLMWFYFTFVFFLFFIFFSLSNFNYINTIYLIIKYMQLGFAP